MASLIVETGLQRMISDYQNNCSNLSGKENMKGGRGESAGELDFDDILQQLQTLSDEINQALIDLNDPDQCNLEPNFRFSFKPESEFHHQFLSEFRSDLVGKSSPGFKTKFRSASVHEPSVEIPSNSTASAEERRAALPVMMAGALQKSSDPSFCCFLSSSKGQPNTGQSSGKFSEKSRMGKKSAGQVLYRFWKSHSEESSQKGRVQTSEGSRLQTEKYASPAKHSFSYDGSTSALGGCQPLLTAMDGVLCSLQNGQASGNPGLLEARSSMSSSREPAKHQSTVTSSHISNNDVTAQNLSSSEQLAGGKASSDNRPPLKTFALDPTKYQLKSSERRIVPQMGRQRRNFGIYSNDASYPVAFEADGSSDDIVCRDSTGLHNSQQIPAANNRQNGSITGTGWKDAPMAETRAHSLGDESGFAGYRADGSNFRSSFASVRQHLSLETEVCEGLQNVMSRQQDPTSGTLISWMSGPDSPEYAVPFDTLVADPNMAINSNKIGTTATMSQNAGTVNQVVRTSRTSGIKVTSANESRVMTKPQLTADRGASLKSYPTDPYEPGAMKNQFACAWKGERLADNNDTLKGRSVGICTAVVAPSSRETRLVTAESKSVSSVPAKSLHPESAYSSQNTLNSTANDLIGRGYQHSVKGLNCMPTSWNQSVPDLQNASNTSAKRNIKSPSASGSVNKVSQSKEPNTTRIQLGQLTSGFVNLNFSQEPTRKSEGRRHVTSASSAEEVSDLFPMPEAENPGTHDPRAEHQLQSMEQSQQRTAKTVYAKATTPWDNTLITEDSGGVNPSESIAAGLRDLFSSRDSASMRNCFPHDYRLSSTRGSSIGPNSQRSDASTETLRDFEDNENDTNDPFNQSCSFSPDISYDHDISNEVFDQNNNQQFFEEDKEEFFGSSLDWCYKWEWDSPTSTLQRSIIQRPAFQRNNSVPIPVMNNQLKLNTDSSMTPSQETNPDVIPMIAPPPRLLSFKNRGHNFPGAKICYYIVGLAVENGFFGAMVKNFVQCTMTGIEMNPRTVIRNIRQFIDGLKNYLMQEREAKLNEFIKRECSKISSEEFLNLDAITERALHKCIIRPLHDHINRLFVYDFTRNGNLQLMADGIKSARTKRIFDLSDPTKVISYQTKSVQAAQHFLRRMTETYSPLKKLENLIAAVSVISGNDKNGSNQTRWSVGTKAPLTTNELLVQLMYVLVDQDMTSAEVEAAYIWGLIHPSFLTGESTYYLTLFSSAITLIKKLSVSSSPTMDNCLQRISANGLLRICIPDEKQDNIWTQTLPFRPNMTTADICHMMAYKLSITNPHEYGLYLINDGEENRLNDTANLNDIKATSSSNHLLAYKRISAKFIWPKSRQ